MARPPEGPNLADRLDGSDEAKKRLKVILETISGDKTIDQAATEIGVKPARFHELRKEVLQAAVEALSPKPVGRPRQESDAQDPRVAELEGQLRELEIEVKASHVREQIARTMPHLLKDETPAVEDESLKKNRGGRARSSIVFGRIASADVDPVPLPQAEGAGLRGPARHP